MERQLVKGERKHNRVTFNPNELKLGEKLYITIPALDSSLSIVPGTTNLIYNIKNSNTKSWANNNMGRLFVQGLQIKLGKDVVYDNTGENIYGIYEDLWRGSAERDGMVGVGVTSVETRKTLCGSDDASTSSTTNGLKDQLLGTLLKNQRIPLGQILDDHGLHSPSGVNFEAKYTLTMPSNAAEIGDKQSSQSVGNFSLENIELEYDTITNSAIVDQQKDQMAQGKNYIIKHVSLESVTEWTKDATLVNENLHISRESLKSIVYLFKWVDQGVDEKYIYPEITEVSCNVNGKPNVIHTNVMLPDMFEKEARRHFEKSKEISTGQFFGSQFCVVLDFRSLGEMNKYNDGIKVNGTSGTQTTFKRKVTTKNVRCYTYVIADSIVQIDSSGFQKTLL